MVINMNELILVVDDAVFARNLTKKALKNGGYENIREAASAKDAMAIFMAEKPDLVLLDITLLDRNDLSLLGDMLKERPDAKIVMNSAIGQDLIIADALSMGARDFISKPFTEEELLRVVDAVLEK